MRSSRISLPYNGMVFVLDLAQVILVECFNFSKSLNFACDEETMVNLKVKLSSMIPQ